ncbi:MULTISPECIES: helicase HerA-like domain-containing protein [unclassified Pseudovibrio]|uniref:helicase HerA-like domain-containing protein n=1 Tax=unclassified Pseudovibrio TaxID=2627060 RepID=UPI0007B237EF|nr:MULTISPECIES: helicase HerA-like domain-containing protein [unclassified Pseudovibrio]KZK94444.1 AAA-like domain protein [Pseudovibrio sp. W74]KZL07196.1 AAA-like domain protein [Pseudovibrio sp. Ad14]
MKLTYDALFWGREKTEGGAQRPALIVMEEAHRYLSGDSKGLATEIANKIAKEGRKYGIGGMVVSQRPSEVDETILAQCGTIFALRLANPQDRQRVQGALPDGLSTLLDALPTLRTGEAIVMGEAAKLPMRCRIKLPRKDQRPDSEDPDVTERWTALPVDESYERVVASWRAQSPRAIVNRINFQRQEVEDMDREQVASSNVRSIGYDEPSQTLEVEFHSGAIYQYFNVSQLIYDQLMAAPSKGRFLNYEIKNAYPYSRVG